MNDRIRIYSAKYQAALKLALILKEYWFPEINRYSEAELRSLSEGELFELLNNLGYVWSVKLSEWVNPEFVHLHPDYEAQEEGE